LLQTNYKQLTSTTAKELLQKDYTAAHALYDQSQVLTDPSRRSTDS
jgi:hypothetical protein